MENWEMVGGVVFALGAIIGLYKTMDSMSSKDREATNKNTKQLMLLNNNFAHMAERDKERDELTRKSIDRLDALSQRVDRHDFDIERLNDKVFVKDRQ